MEFERQLEEARARFVEVNGGYKTFMDILRKKYDAPAGEYELKDWAIGFAPTNGSANELSND